MKRQVRSLLAWLGTCVGCLAILAGVGQAEPEGRPRRIDFVGDLQDHDPYAPTPGYEVWRPIDVVNLLARYPGAPVNLGRLSGLPPGNTVWARRGREVREMVSIASQAKIDVAGRGCVTFRPDVHKKVRAGARLCDPAAGGGGCDWEGDMDGSFGEAEDVVKVAGRATSTGPSGLIDDTASWATDQWAHRLAVVRPRTAAEERRRILGNDATTLTLAAPWTQPVQPGDAYEVRGSFDTDWVLRVPVEAHRASVRRFWTDDRKVCGKTGQASCAVPAEPLDPYAAANQRGWRNDLDRTAIEALRTPTMVPALYGKVYDAEDGVPWLTDPHFSANGVVMDLRKPAYRAWSARYLLYKIQDFGYEPGDAVCVSTNLKSGFYAYRDESVHGPSANPCWLPGTFSEKAPAHVCADPESEGGPFHPTSYRANEYEDAANEWLRGLLATLAANGYPDVRIITAERPAIFGHEWTFLAEDLRFDPRMPGVRGQDYGPPLAEVPDAVALAGRGAGGPPAQSPGPAAPPTSPAPTPPAAPPASPPPAVPPAAPAPPTQAGPDPSPAPSDPDDGWSLGSGPGSGSRGLDGGTWSVEPRRGDTVRSSGGSDGRAIQAPSLDP